MEQLNNIALYNAINNKNIKEIKKALNDGANINSINIYELIVFLDNEYPEILKLLIESGININKLHVFDYSSFATVISNLKLETIKLLLDYGADPNIGRISAFTSLLNDYYPDKEKLKLLVDYDVIITDDNLLYIHKKLTSIDIEYIFDNIEHTQLMKISKKNKFTYLSKIIEKRKQKFDTLNDILINSEELIDIPVDILKEISSYATGYNHCK